VRARAFKQCRSLVSFAPFRGRELFPTCAIRWHSSDLCWQRDSCKFIAPEIRKSRRSGSVPAGRLGSLQLRALRGCGPDARLCRCALRLSHANLRHPRVFQLRRSAIFVATAESFLPSSGSGMFRPLLILILILIQVGPVRRAGRSPKLFPSFPSVKIAVSGMSAFCFPLVSNFRSHPSSLSPTQVRTVGKNAFRPDRGATGLNGR